MRYLVNVVGMLGLALATSGCPTTFTGSAHVENGKAGCEYKCKKSGLRFSGMVYMGEYSSACICELAKPAAATTTQGPSAAAASVGAAVGSMVQARAAEGESSTPYVLSE